MSMKRIAVAVLSLSLLVPAEGAFALTHHRHHRTYARTAYSTRYYRSGPYYSHYYSRTRGTAIGAVAGAVIDHRHPLVGAVIGGALGNAVQYERSRHHRHN